MVTAIVQELIPQLASSLGQLRRAPGKRDAWIGDVVDAFAKNRDPRYDNMRRRIGFAQRLGVMAELSEASISLTSLGLFFHGLLPIKANGARGSRPWREYFLRNEDWLRPALDVCEAIRYKSWEELEEDTEIVAKIAVAYDAGTLERHERSLAVVESIMIEAEGHAAQRIVELLWTEGGQALCDHHFRRHPRGYRLDPNDIRAGFARLYRFTPRVASDVALQSMRFGDDSPTREKHELEVEQPVAQAEHQNGASDNFDRRKSALRERKDEMEPTSTKVEAYDVGEQVHVETPSGIEAKLREIEAKEQQAPVPEQSGIPALTFAAEPRMQAREERMNQITIVPPANAADALDVREKLQELRIQLGQIQQIAAQAEQLLAGIAPTVDEFAARIADVEAVMDRWSGRGRAAA